MEDSKLLRLLHKDPNAGMEQLMNQYAGLVYTVVKSKLIGSQYVSTDIEDCVADTFSEFYTDLNKYDLKLSSIKSFLCVLARNNAIDIIRKRKLQFIDDEEVLLQIPDGVDFVIETHSGRENLCRCVSYA